MTTQNTLILRHLKKTGTITQREALLDYSIQCLTKRIQELRNVGYDIKTNHKIHPITKQRYAEYRYETQRLFGHAY